MIQKANTAIPMKTVGARSHRQRNRPLRLVRPESRVNEVVEDIHDQINHGEDKGDE